MYFLLKRVKKNLVIGFSRRACRNFFGRKTIYTQSGGLTFKLRLIDYKRNLINRGIVLQVEKNITHTALLGLVFFENGLYSYILLSNQNQYKNTSVFGFINKFVMDRPTFIGNIPTGILVYNVEILPGNGGKYIRAAGNSSFIISRDNIFTYLKLNSGWLLKVSNFCISIPGVVSNEIHMINRIKNAGKNRQLGFRPTVRGLAKNACDHPHGGGEGQSSPPRAQRTPWGKLTKVPTKITKLFYIKKRKFKIFEKK